MVHHVDTGSEIVPSVLVVSSNEIEEFMGNPKLSQILNLIHSGFV